MVGLTPHPNNAVANEDDDGTPGEVRIDKVKLTTMKVNFSNEIMVLVSKLMGQGVPVTTSKKVAAGTNAIVDDLAVRGMIIDALLAVACRQAVLVDMPVNAVYNMLLQNFRQEQQRGKP